MLLHPTIENLKQLRLFGMAKALEHQQLNTSCLELSFEDRLGLLVDSEITNRDSLKYNARLRHAKLRQQASMEDLDLISSRGLDKTLVNSLQGSKWIAMHKNVLITGPAGVGKSYLSCALAHQACKDGYPTIYVRTNRLFEELAVARAAGRYNQRISSLAKKHLLIIDDFAMCQLTADQRKDLLEILDERYKHHSTVIVSQLPVENWYEIIGDPTFADAIMDRLIHNAYKFCLKGESMRKKKAEEA